MSIVTKVVVVTPDNQAVKIEGKELDWSWDDGVLDISDLGESVGETIALFAPGRWSYLSVVERTLPAAELPPVQDAAA